jgi:NAD(P)-dependent dehydrogenase (short-subunit alcohol dehydrogenase family)
MTQDLHGKAALVTGGSRGLGRAIALELAKAGADVVITYRSEAEKAEAVVAEIAARGGKATALPVDLEGTRDLPRFLEALSGALTGLRGGDRLDILVNNAGIQRGGVLGQVSEDDYDAIMNTNVKAVFFLTQALLEKLNDGGRIILIGSGLSRFSLPPYIVYGATKAAQDIFARYMAKTLGPRGITVNTVAPGALATDFNRAAFEANPAIVEMIAGNTALGRVGEASDVPGTVAFLAGPDSAWITGQRIEVSGGMFL